MSKPKKTQDETAAFRFTAIAPLVGEGLERALRSEAVQKAAEKAEVSERTVRRWLAAWAEGGFDGLKPSQGYERPDRRLPEAFGEVVEEAIGLRREAPSRSVKDIIKILELEGRIEPGSVPRSTLQRKLQEKGFSAAQLRTYSKKGAAARRFQKEHRCQLWQSDVKYGPYASARKGGRKAQIYLVVWIDDATRFVVGAKFYMTEAVAAIEDSLRAAVQKYGAPDAIFVDNGSAFRSEWLKTACAKLGVKYLRSRPYHPEGKGKIESYNKLVDKFISEAALQKLETVDEYNESLEAWLSEYYHKNIHSALNGVSPQAAFLSDKRPLRFVDGRVLREAFLHSETRKVDKTGCVSFAGSRYEVGLAYVGRRIEIRFDASWEGEIEACPKGESSFIAKRLSIGENCGGARKLPEKFRKKEAASSRMLDALGRQHAKDKAGRAAMATAFSELWGEGENV